MSTLIEYDCMLGREKEFAEANYFAYMEYYIKSTLGDGYVNVYAECKPCVSLKHALRFCYEFVKEYKDYIRNLVVCDRNGNVIKHFILHNRYKHSACFRIHNAVKFYRNLLHLSFDDKY